MPSVINRGGMAAKAVGFTGQTVIKDPYFSYVSLLLTCDGTNGSTSFPDASSNNLTVTSNNGANVTTTYKVFGTGGLSLNGSNQYLSVSTGTKLNFSGDFTIEGWVYFTSIPPSGYSAIFSNGDYAATSQVVCTFTNTSPSFYMSDASGWQVAIVSATSLSLNTWHYIAFTGNGNLYTIWINGVSDATSTVSFTRVSPASTSVIGRLYPSTNSYYFPGYMDEIRITNGVCRYTSNYTTPTQPFPTQ